MSRGSRSAPSPLHVPLRCDQSWHWSHSLKRTFGYKEQERGGTEKHCGPGERSGGRLSLHSLRCGQRCSALHVLAGDQSLALPARRRSLAVRSHFQVSITPLSTFSPPWGPRVVLVGLGSGLLTTDDSSVVWESHSHFLSCPGIPCGFPSGSHLSDRRTSVTTGCGCAS